ncbi:hypothetical protein JCM33774_27090 [Actinophytocola sp. KF-1]
MPVSWLKWAPVEAAVRLNRRTWRSTRTNTQPSNDNPTRTTIHVGRYDITISTVVGVWSKYDARVPT